MATIDDLLTFTLLEDKSGYSVKKATSLISGPLEIPSEYNGLPVTSIEDEAFFTCGYLTSVTIPSSVTSIGNSAFQSCRSLTSVTIPSSVTSIGSFVFGNCQSLSSITIPSSVMSIGMRAFQSCTSLTYFKFDGDVVEEPSNVFMSASNLKCVYINYGATGWGETWGGKTVVIDPISYLSFTLSSDGTYYSVKTKNTSISGDLEIPSEYKGIPVTNIRSSAFKNCSSLTSITIPSSVTSIGDNAFDSCSSLTSITIPSSVTIIGKYLFRNCSSLTSITIPSSVTRIGENAFDSCTSLASVTIPSSVTNISDYAFRNCGLTSITIPSSLAIISDSVFYGCTGLTSIAIPSSVTNINYCAFYGCTSLTSITIPSSVTSIGDLAFGGCTGLTSITVESGNSVYHSNGNCCIKTTENTLFFGCKNSVIPEYVTSIGSNAFNSCTGLTSITIPSSVNTVGNYAFRGCSDLKYFKFEGNAISESTDVLDNTPNLKYVYINPDAKNWGVTWGGKTISIDPVLYLSFTLSSDGTYYSVKAAGSDIAGELEIPAEHDGLPVKEIGTSGFAMSKLTAITIPNSVTTIRKSAFLGCSSLSSISMPSSVTLMEGWTFQECNSLTSIDFLSLASIEEIPQYCFYMCDGLQSANIPNGVKIVGDSAFMECSNLTTITIPSSVNVIQDQAFSHCISLTSVDIPSNVLGIGISAFYGCTMLSSLILHDGLDLIRQSAFSSCSIRSVNIPSSVTSIGIGAFAFNSELEVITVDEANEKYKSDSNCCINKSTNALIFGCKNSIIPNYVTKINPYAFSGQTIESILIPNGVVSIGEIAFAKCENLTSIEIPSGVTSIGQLAFSYCTNLQKFKCLGAPIPEMASASSNILYNTPKLESVTVYKNKGWPATWSGKPVVEISYIGSAVKSGETSLIEINLGDITIYSMFIGDDQLF